MILAVPNRRLLQFAKSCSNLAKQGPSAASLAAVGRSIITPEVDGDGGLVAGLAVIGGAVCAGCCDRGAGDVDGDGGVVIDSDASICDRDGEPDKPMQRHTVSLCLQSLALRYLSHSNNSKLNQQSVPCLHFWAFF